MVPWLEVFTLCCFIFLGLLDPLAMLFTPNNHFLVIREIPYPFTILFVMDSLREGCRTNQDWLILLFTPSNNFIPSIWPTATTTTAGGKSAKLFLCSATSSDLNMMHFIVLILLDIGALRVFSDMCCLFNQPRVKIVFLFGMCVHIVPEVPKLKLDKNRTVTEWIITEGWKHVISWLQDTLSWLSGVWAVHVDHDLKFY